MDARLAAPLERFTPRTMTDVKTLRTELERVRAQGYASTVEELEEGLNAVAAPVFADNGQVIAAISVSGPSFRLTEDRLTQVAAAVRSAAAEISARLGYHAAG
jgi:DNA-binding IclR family transcriptional regulator